MSWPDSDLSSGGPAPLSEGVARPLGPPPEVDVTTSGTSDDVAAAEPSDSRHVGPAAPQPDTGVAVPPPPDTGVEVPPARLNTGAPPPLSGTGDEAPPPLPALLEAVLLVADEPIAAGTLAQVVDRPTDEVEQALRRLAEDYVRQERGFELRTAGGGWRFYSRAECAPWVERFVVDGQQARLTQAALETLAVIAYRQPVTRGRVGAVRGVNVDGVVRTLLARGLVAETGHDEESGAVQYGTTRLFLEKLGLDTLSELPSLAPLLPELQDMEIDWTST